MAGLPASRTPLSMIRRALTLLGLAVVLLGVLAGIWAFVSITTDRPVTYESIEEHFKYGSIGSEPGRDLPIGVSRRRRLGIEQVGLNCAVCHTGTVRETPAAEPRIVLGMPANRLDLQGFVQFVLECSLDNRLTAEAIK